MVRERLLSERLAGHHALASGEGEPLFEVSFVGLLERLEHLKDAFHRTFEEYHLCPNPACRAACRALPKRCPCHRTPPRKSALGREHERAPGFRSESK